MPTMNDFDIIVKAIVDEKSLQDIKGKIAKVQRDLIKETTKVTVKDVGVDELGKKFDATYTLDKDKKVTSATRDYASAAKRAAEETKKHSRELKELAKAQQRVSQQTTNINNKFDTFSNKLLSAKNSGVITEEQFEQLSKSLNTIKNDFNNSAKDFDNFDKTAFQSQDSLTKLNNKLGQYTAEGKRARTTTTNLGDAIQKFTQWYLVAGVVTALIRKIKDIVTQVKLLDEALVELNKVTDLNSKQLDNYVDSAFRLGKQLRTTGVDVINASTEFARAGYTAKEALDLSEVAIKLTNVAEGINNTSDASNVLISVLKGSGIEFENFNQELAMANRLLDQLNNISNNNAISFDNLADMVQSVSATMSTLQNSTSETLSLLTGAYEVLQDTRVAKGISVIGLRIAGLNEDLTEEAGLASSVGDALRDYAGVEVFDEQTQQLRSTYDILGDLAERWDSLTKNAQAYLTTTVAGKNRADVLNALMQNWEGVQNAMEDATDSLGSADKEMEAYYNSIEAHVQSFNNTWQKLSTDFIDSDLIKFIVDGASFILNLIDSMGGIQTVLTEILLLIGILKIDKITSGISKLIGNIKTLNVSLSSTQLILSGIVAVSSIVILILNKVKEAEEERARAIQESYDNSIQRYEEEMLALEELEGRYFDLYNRTNKTENQKEQLIELTKELATAYGLEYEALAKLNGETATAEDVYQSSIDAKIKALKDETQGMYASYQQANDFFNNFSKKDVVEGWTSGLLFDEELLSFLKQNPNLTEKIGNPNANGETYNKYSFNGTREEYLEFLKEYRSIVQAEDFASVSESERIKIIAKLNREISELTNEIKENQEIISEYKKQYSLLSFYQELGDVTASLQVQINDFNNKTLQEQADSYMVIQKRLDELVAKYPEYKDIISGVFKGFYEQVDLLKSTDFLLKKMEDELDSLNELKEARDEELEQQEKLLKVEEARAKLAEAMNKKVRVYRAGQGFVYESDYVGVQDAQEDLAQAIRDAELDDLSQAIKNLTKAIEVYNKAQQQQGVNGSNALREYFMSSENQNAFMGMSYEDKIATLQKYAPNFDWSSYLNPNSSDIDLSGWLNNVSGSSSGIGEISSGGTTPINLGSLTNSNPANYVTNQTRNDKTIIQNIGSIQLPNVLNASSFLEELKQIGFVTKK